MSGAVHHLLDGGCSDQSHIEGDFPIDKSVFAALPQGIKIISAQPYGTSAWTVTARIKAILPDGSEIKYFLKCASGDSGRVMMEGEFNAMSELYRWAPDLVPKLYAWGKYEVDNPETYFILQQYIEMSDRVPEPDQLREKLARLHHLEALEQRISPHVIPRIIGSLEREGRAVRPFLIHADLWEGNTGYSIEDNAVYIFDSGAYYAHNEMDIGDWRCHYNKIHDEVYTETYLRHNDPSEPKEEWDDRNRMYSIYYNVLYSCNHMGQGKAVRQVAYDDMYYLIGKYAPFADGEGPKDSLSRIMHPCQPNEATRL
ncbi:hypothetical protein LTR17_001376 [Elasticomyces elasticus]|nr:hypothetical protein LTR17_001376 [Elasticomyces elasticus]